MTTDELEHMDKLFAGLAAAVAAAIKESQPKPAHRGWHPIAVCGLAVALVVPVASYEMTLSARVTALETIAAAPSKDSVQIAALSQKVDDLRADLYAIEAEIRVSTPEIKARLCPDLTSRAASCLNSSVYCFRVAFVIFAILRVRRAR
jgi:phage shock protein A